MIKVAVLDMNNGEPNLGLGAIVDAVESYGSATQDDAIGIEVFDVRAGGEIPGMHFDAFVSSGGPGSPYDGEGQIWEAAYFRWLDRLAASGKPALLICHSYEMMVHHFGLAEVTERRSPSFGIFPVHPTEAADADPVLCALDNPFYAADFRYWQVVQPNPAVFEQLNATILAKEKIRDHVPLERAVMAVRVGASMLGLQFHPEASPEGMALHFLKDEKMKHVVSTYGEDTFQKMLRLLEQPAALAHTHATVIPRFLHHALVGHD